MIDFIFIIITILYLTIGPSRLIIVARDRHLIDEKKSITLMDAQIRNLLLIISLICISLFIVYQEWSVIIIVAGIFFILFGKRLIHYPIIGFEVGFLLLFYGIVGTLINDLNII
jgi:hypothetical protein